MSAEGQTTTGHQTINEWAEERDGRPTEVQNTDTLRIAVVDKEKVQNHSQ